MQRRIRTQGEQGNEPITSFHHQDVTLVISLSKWFCLHEEDLQ
jgi:hypothetical protein